MFEQNSEGLKLFFMVETAEHDHLVAATVAIVHRVHRPIAIMMKGSESVPRSNKDMRTKLRPFLVAKLNKDSVSKRFAR